MARKDYGPYKKKGKDKKRKEKQEKGFSTLNQVTGVPKSYTFHSSIPVEEPKVIKSDRPTCPICGKVVEDVSSSFLDKEGNVIHYGFIEKFIEQLGETYNIREIAYDRWNATQMVQNLEDMGFTMVPFGQGFKDMSPPSKELFKLLMEGNIIHGGNPVLKWMAGNVVMRQDPAGNIKPDKEKSVEKIDGIVASIMALDRCIRNGTGSGSVYDERGVISF